VVVDATEEDTELLRRSGPRYPRPHLQRLDTNTRLAEGTLPPEPPPPPGDLDFDEAITEVNTPVPRRRDRPRSTTAS
jgi:hypothetical protein